jgi:hypothetical protein
MAGYRKRPRDFSQAAKLVVDIATGQVEDRPPTPEERGKRPKAVSSGREGGKLRAAKMSPDKRAEIARKAAAARWRKVPAVRGKKEPA